MTDVLVLCYHAVSTTWAPALSVTPDRLEEQLQFLLGRGYRGATFTEAVTAAPARKTLAVTFDDGFHSVVARALPILARLDLPATIFVPTAFVGRREPLAWPGIDEWLGGPHEQELRSVSWDDLASLAAQGWEVGSHTRTHPHLTQLGDAALTEELCRSRRECEERLGAPCTALAYPYGDVDERVVRATRAAGYSAAAALPDHIHRPARLRWPRVGVWHRDSLPPFSLKVSPVRRRVAALPAGQALLGAERRLRKAVTAAR